MEPHLISIHARGLIVDDDSGDWFGSDEKQHYSTSGNVSVIPGGTAGRWAYDSVVVDGEVQLKLRLNLGLDQNYNLTVNGGITLWENDRGNANWSIPLSIVSPGNTAVVYNSKVTNGGGDNATIYIEVHVPPIPKYSFAPSLALHLDQFLMDTSKYLVKPKTIAIDYNLNVIGFAAAFTRTLDFPEDGTVHLNEQRTKDSFSFGDLAKALSADVSINAKEQFASFVPDSETLIQWRDSFTLDSGCFQWTFNPVERSGKNDFIRTWDVSLQFGLYTLQGRLILTVPASLYYHSEEGDKAKVMENEIDKIIRQLIASNVNQSDKINVNIKLLNKDVPEEETTLTKNPGKKVSVLQESETGLNKRFKDSNGNEMTREEFVAAIQLGLYPGYHVRMINGVPTPVSNPDSTKSNNLG